MNGGADLGGMMGFGPIDPERDEPNFHAPWEARVMGMVVALGASGQWNLDQSRFSRESLPTAEYLTASYYEIWLKAVTGLLLEREMVAQSELDTGAAQIAPKAIKRRLRASDVPAALAKGGPVDRPSQGEPAFKIGDRIHTINDHPTAHTRLPRYARDKQGTITRIHGFHVYPDSNAAKRGEDPKWLYQVSFDADALWGAQGRRGDTITLDLWEPYLRSIV